MAMQMSATESVEPGAAGHPPPGNQSGDEHLQPVASLTGDLVMRGRKRSRLQAFPSLPEAVPMTEPEPPAEVPAEVPVAMEPPIPVTATVEPEPQPDDTPDQIPAIAASGDVAAIADADMGPSVQWFKWFKVFRNAAIFIVLFWIGAVATLMLF